nr:unnamed protein product [Haemonchus contortus]
MKARTKSYLDNFFFKVFETKNESGVNYTKCLREAFKKGAFLSPRLFETGDANNGYAQELKAIYQKTSRVTVWRRLVYYHSN